MQGIFGKTALIMAMAGALAACGGGGGDVGSSYAGTGELTLRVADAPVDGATAVNITILSVELKRSGSDSIKRIRLDGNGQNINLMDYAGLTTLPLFTEQLASGEYQWARFELDDNATICFGPDPINDCEELDIPRNQEIKTSRAFSVPSNGVVEYVVDWDLRKSVVETNQGYQLKPVLHLRPYASDGIVTVGYIEGSINSAALNNCDSPAVYLYPEGSQIDDIHPNDSVITSLLVSESGEFLMGSLEPDRYQLAFTCDASADDLTANDADVTFHQNVLTVTVPSGEAAAIGASYPFEPAN